MLAKKKYVASMPLQWKLWGIQMGFQSGPSAVLLSVFERIGLEIGIRIEVGVEWDGVRFGMEKGSRDEYRDGDWDADEERGGEGA